MKLFLRGTPGTGEDHGAGGVAGAHGAEEKQGRDKGSVHQRGVIRTGLRRVRNNGYFMEHEWGRLAGLPGFLTTI